MPQFEYKREVGNISIPHLNSLGKEGWELVSIVDKNEVHDKYWYFKRQIQEEQKETAIDTNITIAQVFEKEHPRIWRVIWAVCKRDNVKFLDCHKATLEEFAKYRTKMDLYSTNECGPITYSKILQILNEHGITLKLQKHNCLKCASVLSLYQKVNRLFLVMCKHTGS